VVFLLICADFGFRSFLVFGGGFYCVLFVILLVLGFCKFAYLVIFVVFWDDLVVFAVFWVFCGFLRCLGLV